MEKRVLVAIAAMLSVLLLASGQAGTLQGANSKSVSSQNIQQASSRTTTKQAFLRTLVASRAPGGFIWMMKCDGEETFLQGEPDILPLENALDSLTRMDPRYKWQTETGVINLIPSAGEPELLKTRIRRFKTNTDLNDTLRQLLALQPVKQAADRLGLRQTSLSLLVGSSPLNGGPSRISVDVYDGTLRKALNALVKAHGRAVWEYRESSCDGVNEFTVTFLAR